MEECTLQGFDMSAITVGEKEVPVITANTVIVGTGSAGFAAAERLWTFGCKDIVMVTDKVGGGTSRNAGSDKQTYYKLTLAGAEPDSVREMANTLFSGGAMDGDNALAEAALSAGCFLRLCDLGVPFPQNRYGEYIGYKTDHDPRRRATSVGPYTSKSMVECLEKRVESFGIPIMQDCRIVDIVADEDGVQGLLVLRTQVPHDAEESPFLLFQVKNIIYATGGPAAIYAKRVFPNGQWGATGAAFRAGVRGKNLTEWQFGLASLHPRWNVSGTYMQVIPRFVSTDQNGGDEKEFLAEAITDKKQLQSLVFLKGYQWPFDVRKAAEGSSLIDLLVYQETVLRGRRVFLDFRSNPGLQDFDADALSLEAHEYLKQADALHGRPIDRLIKMNEPAYQFYLEKNPSVDLKKEMLEVAVCAQHNNGGLVVDHWWQSNLDGFFPIGEAAGAHGVYRPGGSALNSGQVGAERAARFVSARRTGAPSASDFASLAGKVLLENCSLLDSAVKRGAELGDNTDDTLRWVQTLMSEKAGPVRSAQEIKQAAIEVASRLAKYADEATVQQSSRRSVDHLFLVRDVLTSAFVYLSAMADYLEHGGHSRGSVLYSDPGGMLPGNLDSDAALPELFRFSLESGELDGWVQEIALDRNADSSLKTTASWRRVRPIPKDDDFFENVWRQYREDGNIF